MKEKNMQNKNIEIGKSQEKKTRAKGITLIALVVTVVILLILAGISINLVLGENGIISKAQESKLKSDNATVSDSLKMMIARYSIDDMGEGKTDVLARLNSDGITDANDVINVPVLVGKKLGTGNGSGTSDVYVIEDNKLYYYDKKGEKTDLGDIDNLQFSGDKQESGIFVITSDGTVYMKDRQSGFYTKEIDYTIKEVIIPSEINGIKVRKLGNYMFCGYASLKNVVIPSGVNTIGEGAFEWCENLETVDIPDSVENIGKYAFLACGSLKNITIPENIKNVNRICIEETKWWQTLPNGLVYFNNTLYKYKGDMPANTEIKIKDGTTTIADSAFLQKKEMKKIQIPNSVTTIGKDAFNGCKGLTSVVIPNGVISIDETTFYDCIAITSITIPESVTSIRENAFSNCTAITSITIPESVTSIDGYAFFGCTAMTFIKIPTSVEKIGGYAFYGCSKLANIIFENDSINDIGDNAFGDTPWFNEYMNNQANGLVYIGNSLITYKGDMPSNTTITIKEGITTIPQFFFQNCTNMVSITIPKSVTYIGMGAFYMCDNLKTINYKGSKEDWNNITIEEQAPDGSGITATINYNYK